MEIVGKHVEHTVFGGGIVAAQSGKRITISFKSGDKKFSFPEVFRHFCTIDDEQLSAEIQNALMVEDHAMQERSQNERDSIRNVQDFRAKYKIK